MIPRRTERDRALASAAEEPLRTLHKDREHFARRGETTMATVLGFLAGHLFEGGLTGTAVARASGSNERSISRRLRAYNSQSLSGYISALRLETAMNWLRSDPQIGVEVVAASVGLTAWRLRRLCRDWLGQPPTSCRLPAPPFNPEAPATWQRVARGQLAPAEQRELAAYIRDTWPAAYEAATCAAPTTANDAESTPNLGARIVDRDALVRSFAEDQLWPLLSGLSYEAQREIVARYPFTSPALFDL
ncbi:MAG: helix-turn-helix domain-containing protein, partial [bacterium]|nr:helix-turn-helix domain-containing protein [bacterium]